MVPRPGRDSIVSSPPTSSARSRIPAIPRPRSDSSKAKPRPSSATSSVDAAVRRAAAAAPRSGRRRCGGRRWRAPPGRPGRRPAGRRRRGRRSRPRRRTRPRSRRAPSCSTWPAIAAARPRSSSAVGRSWRARESSSRIAWLASALVSASSRLELRRRRLARRLQPQQQPGQRLVDLVVEVAGDPRPLLLLGLQGGRCRRAAARPRAGASSAGRRARSAPPPRSRRRRRSRRAGAARAGSGRPSPSPRSAAPAARAGAASTIRLTREHRHRGRRARRSTRVVAQGLEGPRGSTGRIGVGTYGRNPPARHTFEGKPTEEQPRDDHHQAIHLGRHPAHDDPAGVPLRACWS